MRPENASQPLLMHMNCCHSTVLLLGWQLSPENHGFCCVATMKCQDTPSTLDPDLHIQAGHQLVQQRGNGKLGLLNHQGTSWAQGRPYFPWLPVPWRRSPGGVGSDSEGGKGAQRQGDSNIHKMRVQKEIAQAGSNWCVFCAPNMPAFVYFFNLNKSQALNGKSDFCFLPLLVLQLKRSFYMALKIKLQKAQTLCPGGRESSHQTGRKKGAAKAGSATLPRKWCWNQEVQWDGNQLIKAGARGPEKSRGQFAINVVSTGKLLQVSKQRDILLMKDVSSIFSPCRLKQLVERTHQPTSRSNSDLEIERMGLGCNFSNLCLTQTTRIFLVLQYHLVMYSFTQQIIIKYLRCDHFSGRYKREIKG